MYALALLPLLLSPLPAEGQETVLRPRWMPTKSLDLARQPQADPHRIVLKVVDDAGARAVDGRLEAGPAGEPLVALRALLADYPGVRVERKVRTPDATLRHLRERGQARIGEELADMTQYFDLAVPHGLDADALLAGLLALGEVENAYVQPEAALTGDIMPPTPDFTALQGYRGPAPDGVDFQFADAYAAGGGLGQTIVDIEWGWNVNHEDLTQLDTSDYVGLPPSPSGFDAVEHGTKVAGVIVGDRDAAGVTGCAPDATLKLAPVQTSDGWVLTQALLDSAALLSPGDVILIEVQFFGPNAGLGAGQFGGIAVEYYDAPFNAIRTATANGIHVVEAAGNGEQNLDSTVPPAGLADYPDKFWLSRRDSGALVIGGAVSTPDHAHNGTTNWGSRVDAYSWGQNVTTTGHGAGAGGDEYGWCNIFPSVGGEYDQYYTQCFNGTSSASSIVAPAVAVINAVHRDAHGVDYGVNAMRLLLRSTGTLSSEYGIARQPDLRQQLPMVGTGPFFTLYELPDNVLQTLTPGLFPDLNGDNRAEWFVGQFEDPPAGLEPQMPGAMEMFDGATGELLFLFKGTQVGDRFGAFVLPVADLDADGLPEAMAGAPGSDDDAGSVVFLSTSSGQTLFDVVSDKQGERFGSTAVAIGDWNGDGTPDYAVGAPAGLAGDPAPGRVVGISGADGAELWVINGQNQGERFGTALALLANASEGDDSMLAIGAPGDATGFGRVAFYSLADLSEKASHDGPSKSSRFGETLVASPDADGDGAPDLFVGAPGENQLSGAVRLVTHNQGDLGVFVAGGPDPEELGHGLALTPDHDGDGEPDLVVGAPGANGVGDQGQQLDENGRVLVVSSSSGALLGAYQGAATGNRFGSFVAGGSLDGLDAGDVLVASAGAEGPALDRGAAYLYQGKSVGGLVVPNGPVLSSVTPSAVQAVSVDGATWVELGGQNLGAVLRVAIDGRELLPDEILVVDDATLQVAVPLVGQLGSVPVEVETTGGTATTSLVVIANTSPVLDVRPGLDVLGTLAMEVLSSSQGLTLVVGSQPGDLSFLLFSASDLPTFVPGLIDLDIGNGFQSLIQLAAPVIGAKGWESLTIPNLPELANPYDLHFQALVIDPLNVTFPLPATNAQSMTVDG